MRKLVCPLIASFWLATGVVAEIPPWEKSYLAFRKARESGDANQAYEEGQKFISYFEAGFFPNDWRVKKVMCYRDEELARRRMSAPVTLVQPAPEKPRRSRPRAVAPSINNGKAFDRLMRRAEKEMSQGKFEAADRLYQMAERLRPESAELKAERMRLEKEMGKPAPGR